MKITGSRRRLCRVLWLLTLLLVIVGSLLPASATPAILRNVNDKVLHVTAYVALGLLPALYENWLGTVFYAAAAIGAGVLLEYGQLLSPGRTCDSRDMLADVAGVLLGLALGRILQAMIGNKPA